MTIALQVIVSGLAAGGVYGLFAAGYSLIYRLTGIIHFAFGDLVGLGIFATLLVLAGTSPGEPGRARTSRASCSRWSSGSRSACSPGPRPTSGSCSPT